MNDRYLCRAKRNSWRELPKEKWWVEGYYAYIQPYHYIMPKDNFDSWIEIDEKTLCACTRLKDKNGNLIWENDVVSVNGTLYVCRFDEENFDWEFQNCKETIGICCFHSSDIEITGNAIDNPELLEVGE